MEKIAPQPIAVIGAGSIGTAFAIVFARAGHIVRLYDADPARLDPAARLIEARLADLAAFDLLGRADFRHCRPHRRHGRPPQALADAAYVQECAPEDAALKRQLFAELDRLAPPEAVLASASSAIPISAIAAGLAGRARLPRRAPGQPALSPARGRAGPRPFTASGTVDAAADLLEAAGMVPVRLAKEAEGFVFNRLQGAVLREAYACCVRDGVASVEAVDAVMRAGLGRRWAVIGPFETADLNIRGGIEAHSRRMGPAYARMGAERGQDDPWTPELSRQGGGRAPRPPAARRLGGAHRLARPGADGARALSPGAARPLRARLTGGVASPPILDCQTVVVGGGIVGLCLAWFLAAEGVEVAVLDDGGNAGTDGQCRQPARADPEPAHPPLPELLPGVEAALPMYPLAVRHWQRLTKLLPTDIDLRLTGGLMVAEDEEQLDFLRAKAARERALGLEVEILDRSSLDRIAPYLGPAVVGAERCASEGKVDPLAANTAIAAASRAAGVDLQRGTRVLAITPDGAGHTLQTTAGTVRAGRLVIAAGAGTGALLVPLGVVVPTAAEPLHMNVTEPAAPLIGHLVQHAERMITMKQLATGQLVIGGGWPARAGRQGRPPEVLRTSLAGNLGLAVHIVP
ncbi:MAG: FAD-dependent oxidoreductase [Geminicoccaceae bacterium]